MKQNIGILGCGGFIGSHILDRLLCEGYRVNGLDRHSDKISRNLENPAFHFVQADVQDREKVRQFVEASDTVISLIALCNPALYTRIPIDVIDASFVYPQETVKMCSEMGKWLIHFSTSEVYGKTSTQIVKSTIDPDLKHENPIFREDTTPLILGPVNAQRWCYACAKQLLERTIYAYSTQKDLAYTIVRPFNFIGPRMDFIPGIDGEGVPRVLACFMNALLRDEPLKLVDGGRARRVFTYIADAVDAVMAILRNPKPAQGQILNIGNPGNEISIAELAEKMIGIFGQILPGASTHRSSTEYISAGDFYGAGYEDSDRRMPDIAKARTLLGWEPKTDLDTALRLTMKVYYEHYSQQVLSTEER